ncbi:hypothetical protein SAMN05216323_10783 [Williamwhitmania taraxaci]|uniref:Uncharacterized protein n=1 Tax=Williamwhitmania taraxaci TaxID=1640674 RepID=A0A1G6RPL9_9BACT|nr:hypothetical protein SAMN05216323_10783 [Williamwhitmania taraxaci]
MIIDRILDGSVGELNVVGLGLYCRFTHKKTAPNWSGFFYLVYPKVIRKHL